MSLIFIFIDGVGLAPAGPDNPLTEAHTPVLRALLGGPMTIERVRHGDSFVLKAIDATLGVAGLPQSGTGQTALLAGVNAAALHGRHQPYFPPVALRSVLAERSIFRRVGDRGGRAAFANAFGPGYWQAVAARRIRRSASVIAAEGARLRFRDGDDLRAGRAVSWDVTGEAMRARDPSAATSLVTPREAGANLARLACDHDLVFYESFLPDLAGHGRLTNDQRPTTNDAGDRTKVHRSAEPQIQRVMGLIDSLIGGVIGAMRNQDTLLVTSDHGNVESVAAPAHTRNPVPLLVVGPGARAFAPVENIAGIADAIMVALLY